MQPTLVPPGGSALDVLAIRFRAALDKMQGGREQWIEGVLELADVVAELRKQYPDHHDYSRWINHHRLEQRHPAELAALAGLGKLEHQRPGAGRKLLEQHFGLAIRTIWENKRDKLKSGPSENRKGRNWHDASGSKKRNRIPDVMRDETPMLPPKPQKRLSDYGLTREQVDPDFKGTAVEFAAKYGPVNLHTKDQIEHNKRQEALMVWLGTVTDHARTAQALLLAPAVDPATLQEWKGKLGKADKLRTWVQTIQTACDALTSGSASSGPCSTTSPARRP